MPGIVAAVLRLEEETPSLVQGEYLAGLCGGAGGEEHECRYVSFHCRGWFWCLVAKIIQRRLKIKFSVAGAVSVRGGHPRSAVRRCAGRMPAGGLCPCIAPLGGCMLVRAGWAGCMAGHMAGAGLGESRVACVACRGRCRKEEFRKSSGELPGIKKRQTAPLRSAAGRSFT